MPSFSTFSRCVRQTARVLVAIFGLASPLGALAETIAPRPVSVSRPEYPPELKKAGKEGKVVVRVRVEIDGSVGEASIKSSNEPALGEAALVAVRTWKFEPGQRDGKILALTVEVPFVFSLSFEERINHVMKRDVFAKFDEAAVPSADLKEKPRLKMPIHPTYPRSLLGSGISETVTIEYVINTKGEVLNPTIISIGGRDEMRLAALGTVIRYEYEPIKHQGKPVNVRMTTSIKLADPGMGKTKKDPGGKD